MKKEITLSVAELKECLPGFNKITGKGRALPILQSIRINRDKSGTVTLQATDLDSFATYTLKHQQPGPVVDLLIPFEQFNKTVKGLKGEDTISLIPESKDKVRLQYPLAGNLVKQTLSTPAVDEFPPIPEIQQEGTRVEAGFGAALKQALACCSEDTSRHVLRGAYLDLENKDRHYIVGTNGRCLFSANSFCFELQKSVIVPDSKFLSWTDLMDDESCSLAVEPAKPKQDASWLRFQSSRWQFITREIVGEYPKWRQVILQTNGKWTRIELNPHAVEQMLQVIPRLPGNDEPNHTLRLSVAGNGLKLEGQNKDDESWTAVLIPNVTVTGKTVCVGLNREYLVKALRFGFTQLEIEDSLSPILFSDNRRTLVIMPINLNPEVKVQQAKAQNSTSEAAKPSNEQNNSQSQPETNERSTMPRTRTVTPTPITTTETMEHQNGHGNGNGNGSAIKAIVDHVEKIKEDLKQAIRDLSTVSDTIKLAEKEKRTTEKEIELIRSKLRQIQNVTI